MSLAAGTKLGPYEVVAPLGAGGMGEVWRARDPRLGRDVAIKALPAAFAQDAERVARFEREAKLLASLSHPNVAGIHGIELVGETRYLVLEFVDGETLEAHLKRGRLPLGEVLDVAKQVAAGVEAAHESGVVHRDLKPGNVMLTASGAVKVLDFGLAKGGTASAASASDPGLSASPTMTYALGTQAGVILGTAAYMSPEQARGKAVDRRTDIWSFGCVLYEMLAGQRAYDGETVSDMVARILEREPDWSAVPATTPPRLLALLKRCLAKDAKQRQRDIGDVRLELEAIAAGDGGAAGGEAAAPATRRGAPAWALASGAIALLAIGAAATWWVSGTKRAPAAPLVRFTLASPPSLVIDSPSEAAISPDGRQFVFTAVDSSGTRHLVLRSFANPEFRVIPGTDHGALAFWSPDARAIGFFADGKLRRVALDGSPPTDLCDAPDGRGASWSRTGTIVFAPNNQGGLARVAESGGTATAITAPDTSRRERGHRYPQFLPDGRHFLYVAIGPTEEVTTFASSIDGGKPVEVARGGTEAVWSDAGYLLWLDGTVNSPRRRLLARRFDPAHLRTIGDARLVIDRVSTNNFGYANVATGIGGALVVEHWDDARYRLAWRDPSGRPAGTAVEDIPSATLALSPDERWFAYANFDPADLYVRNLATGVTTRLTFANQVVNNIVWSPDGRRIAFSRLSTSRGWEARTKNADGSGPDSLLFHGPGLFTYPQAWSHDGAWLLARCSDPSGNFDLWRIPMNGTGRPSVYERTPENEGAGSFSADDRWIACTSLADGKRTLLVQSFPEPGAKYEVSIDRLGGGGWDPAGRYLLASDETGQLLRIDASTEGGFHQGATTRLFRVPNGESIVDIDRTTGRLLMSTLINGASGIQLDVMLGWTHLLEKK